MTFYHTNREVTNIPLYLQTYVVYLQVDYHVKMLFINQLIDFQEHILFWRTELIFYIWVWFKVGSFLRRYHTGIMTGSISGTVYNNEQDTPEE